MTTVNLDDLDGNLAAAILAMSPGEQLVIVRNGQPVATLARRGPGRWPCKAGSAKATRHWMASDFDAPLEEFREYS